MSNKQKSMSPQFSLFNCHVNDAKRKLLAYVRQHMPKEMEDKLLKAEADGIMSLKSDNLQAAFMYGFIAGVTNHDRIEGEDYPSKKKDDGSNWEESRDFKLESDRNTRRKAFEEGVTHWMHPGVKLCFRGGMWFCEVDLNHERFEDWGLESEDVVNEASMELIDVMAMNGAVKVLE